jgi:hypothetical protein
MTSFPRGRALIINNSMFKQRGMNREGSQADVKNLEELFNQLGFTVTIIILFMSGGELLEMQLLDKKWNRSFFICRTCINI